MQVRHLWGRKKGPVKAIQGERVRERTMRTDQVHTDNRRQAADQIPGVCFMSNKFPNTHTFEANIIQTNSTLYNAGLKR